MKPQLKYVHIEECLCACCEYLLMYIGGNKFYHLILLIQLEINIVGWHETSFLLSLVALYKLFIIHNI